MIRFEIPISRDLLEQMGLGSPNLSIEWDVQQEVARVVLSQGSKADATHRVDGSTLRIETVGEEEQRPSTFSQPHGFPNGQLTQTELEDMPPHAFDQLVEAVQGRERDLFYGSQGSNVISENGPSYDTLRRTHEYLSRLAASPIQQNITGAVETGRLTQVRGGSNLHTRTQEEAIAAGGGWFAEETTPGGYVRMGFAYVEEPETLNPAGPIHASVVEAEAAGGGWYQRTLPGGEIGVGYLAPTQEENQ